MTTEPKFIPEDAVRISIDAKRPLTIRMLDCVGYISPARWETSKTSTPHGDDALVRRPIAVLHGRGSLEYPQVNREHSPSDRW
jgi:hypothetical protein